MPNQHLKNVAQAVYSFLQNHGSPIHTLDDIMRFPRDEHGNIHLGISSQQLFIVVTDEALIKRVLAQLRNQPGKMVGNTTTSLIGKLFKADNMVATQDRKAHADHKATLKNFLGSFTANLQKSAPIIQQWLQQHIRRKQPIQDDSIENLCSQIMTRFLLDESSANNPEIVAAVIAMKAYLIQRATFKLTASKSKYDAAVARVVRAISETCLSDPHSLTSKFFESGLPHEQIESEICSLLMVGFDNLRSSLGSLLIYLAKHPDERDKLKSQLFKVQGMPYLQFDPYARQDGQSHAISQQYYQEVSRLIPPIWLIARKIADATVEISYSKQGKNHTCVFPPNATILVPVFQLARELINGNEFIPNRTDQLSLDLTFGTGPNACPGRNIGFSAGGALVGAILDSELIIEMTTTPKLTPTITLTPENLSFTITHERDAVSQNESHTLMTNKKSFLSQLWSCAPSPTLIGAAGGVTTCLAAFYETQSVMFALGTGSVSAGLLWRFLNSRPENKITDSLQVFNRLSYA